MSFVDNLVFRFRSKRGDNCSVEAEKSGGAERAKSSYAEYVTPACHYDDNTLLNKGGELVQIIEVVDSKCTDGMQSLRDGIRGCISSIKDPDVAFWVYTVREKKKFDLEWRSTGDFSDTLHDVYKSYIDEKYETYDNKVYVAVVVKHLAEGLDGMVNALLFNRVMNKHKSYLAKRASYLTTVTEKIMGGLSDFSTKKLGLIDCGDGRWRSELLEFLSYLVTFRHRECYLETCDNAHTVSAGCDLHMGFNAFKVIDNEKVKYGAILGVKVHASESLDAVDACLQQECEFIIVEIIKFIEGKELKKLYARQAALLEISGDEDLAKLGHLPTIMQLEDSAYGDCCERQVNCVVIADGLQSLRSGINGMVSAFSTIGALAVRLDLAMEDSFWALMPGNFRYVIYMKAALMQKACTFVVLHSYLSFSAGNTKWPDSITVFFSSRGLPYFFNFQCTGKGHTVCLGPHDSSMTALSNFLLSEARRLQIRSVVFDYSGKSIIYANAIGGSYHRIDDRPEYVSATFNPFNVEDTAVNRDIAAGVLYRMARPTADTSDAVRQAVLGVVDEIFAIPLKERTKERIGECVKVLGGGVNSWFGNGRFAHLLTDSTNIQWHAEFLGINAAMLVSKTECLSVVLYYIVRSMENHLDGKPLILVMYEAWLLDFVFETESEFDNWVNGLSELNVVVVFASENIKAISSSRVIKYVSKHADTRIFMPNFMMGSKQHGRMFGLTQEEQDIMLQISQAEGHFFLKQGNASVVLSLKLPTRESRILTANRTSIRMMYDAIAEKGKDWIEAFHDKCDAAK
ncbi:Type IV secretion system protein virB4 [Anaplasma phagocytophilum]|uniref:VirB4 family type IV secretion system protein n=1 Tax=Anaplasma phagocytophilum TaxID=948 RepID=UPI0007DEB23F|nr:hypothetical protein [Anaplasma phagocytophilum]SCV66136.1 Type IV secretion system protein virB4 [Anaplasma phagocytophilum]